MSKTHKLTVILMSILCSSYQLMAQSGIKGQIKTGEEVVPFANILLLNPADSSLQKGTISDPEGFFSLVSQPATYLLKVTSVGYQDFFQTVTLTNAPLDLGVLEMAENTEVLGEVVVTAQKPIFEQKIDRTVVNVQSSVTASAGTALDILEKSPGVTVNRTNNSIAMAGKQGVRIMINGKITRMPLDAAVQMLNGMNAESVESVELITTPPAKYEAEGNAGMINIVLKQSTDQGTNGSYSVFAGYGDREKLGGNMNFNHRNKKLNLFGNYSYRYDNTRQINENRRTIIDNSNIASTTETISRRDPYTITHNAQLGFDYKLTDASILGASVNYFNSHWDMDAKNEVLISEASEPVSHTLLLNQEVNDNAYLIANINFAHDINDKQNISLEMDYINYDSENPTDYQQTFTDLSGSNNEMIESEIESRKVTPLTTWVPRIDYTFQLNENSTFEAGLKGAFNQLENDVDVTYINNNVREVDENLTRKVFLTEDILAAYASVNFKLTPSIDVKGGLRYEQTITDIDSESGEKLVRRNFGRMFPSLFLNKKINDNNSYTLSYSRRITRPQFRDIAPFVIFLDPYTFWTGNEALKPAITDSYKAEYRFKTYLITAQYDQQSDAIAGFQPRIAEDGETQLTTVENLDNIDNYSLSLAIPVQVTKWWEMQYNVTSGYSISKSSHLDVPITNRNFFWFVNGSSSFKLPKGFTIEASGFYFSTQYFGIVKFKGVAVINFGLQKKLKDDNGSFKLSINDAFKGRNFRGTAVVPEENINIFSRFAMETQIFNLTYSRNFGNNKLKKLRNKTTSNGDERRRIE